MTRIHRSLVRRAKKIDPALIADRAEDYIFGFGRHKRYLNGVRGISGTPKLKNAVKRIDALDREVEKLEKRIDTILLRRGILAAKLEDDLNSNLAIARKYLDPEEYKDLIGGY